MSSQQLTQEEIRLKQDRERQAYWRRWGCYLSDRQWGTVREDYSKDGSAWDYFTFEQSHYRAYRWGEDGIAGISDNHQRLCFAPSFWNGQDPFLKERLFGLTNKQGNHGEDVKECYFHLDNTPTHSYMKYLYKYPQNCFPYEQLKEENEKRGFKDGEFEILDSGIFDNNQYFDITIEYAKASDEDILIKIHIANRSSEAKELHLLPTLWFRNNWSWDNETEKPNLKIYEEKEEYSIIEANHNGLAKRWLYCPKTSHLLFTENETNYQKLSNKDNNSPYVKDGFNNYIIKKDNSAVSSDKIGTKFAAYYCLEIPGEQSQTITLRLCDNPELESPFDQNYENIFDTRRQEAEEFYQRISPYEKNTELRNIQRQAFAGLLWNKQYYYYEIDTWLAGDPDQPSPPKERKKVRNSDWQHIHIYDVISMPDKWEYPYFAAWDWAFHLIPLATIDPDFAKKQLLNLTREWYMHPNGQLPAYEWDFNGVNPPVQAWAAWRIYTIERKMYENCDKKFLERVFQKLLLNFTWWINRQDEEGNNVFQGGFLGLDNIGVFDRGGEAPMGGKLTQSDATSWVAMYCLNMLTIALELAQENDVYEDMASKFFEHFLYIVEAMNHIGAEGARLWNEEDGFYYDVLDLPDGENIDLKVRSLVGLIPLLAVANIESETLEKLPNFSKQVDWFVENRPQLSRNLACLEGCGQYSRRLLAMVDENKLRCLLEKMLDEKEFLSDFGVRSLSRYHADNPYIFKTEEETYSVGYEPAESQSAMFGGNSNWRGPVWFPINYLLIEALQKFDFYYGEDFKVECPKGSGKMMSLWEVSLELERRLVAIFLADESGNRPVFKGMELFNNDPHWQNLLLFCEYFHGDSGKGLGAAHQTGWTGLIAKLILQRSEYS